MKMGVSPMKAIKKKSKDDVFERLTRNSGIYDFVDPKE
eukprot:CAMPEP_0176344028 /NCGR_PEP_ID=MMETSP0126-20121128/4383_1 /TAXON_ID=141414 ORGANISM="Strombidinopsis acuminatum, Strain SPMC142" /NCGR_SAMPLE_ID=MMETSP0126 /ASSEMBLY_ACC=CAM_ASM_000229 /LENGTH=37 /DNA_ID= /DNA_START= /DNA_END= /DNA_ORIENTATION=